MASNKLKFVTEKGTARYLVLGREETIKGKPTGKQGGQIVWTGPQLDVMKAKIQEYVEDTFTPKEIKAGKVNLPFKEKDGETFIKFTAYVKTKDGDRIVIPVMDSKGKVIANPPQIGNGSVVKYRVQLQDTEFGGEKFVQCRLLGVQLLRLVEYTGGGFEADDSEGDEGFVADDEFENNEDTPDSDAGDHDDF